MASTCNNNPYIGRFAPSPTGPLHSGSMLAALGSYLQARKQNGKWLVRIEDLDPPREINGASDDILRTLEKFKLYWDGEVTYQSRRHELYREALDALDKKQLIYPCTCTRKIIQESAIIGPLGMIYPGYCRTKKLPATSPYSLRIRVPELNLSFADELQGTVTVNLLRDIGDIVLHRADGFFAYHLAVVVDDHEQLVSEIVRGCDLLYSTPIHIFLQEMLGFTRPQYLHLPVIQNPNGEKLSKQTGASKIDTQNPENVTLHLLKLLNQNPPVELQQARQDEILNWAIAHWQIKSVNPKNIVLEDQTLFKENATPLNK